MASNWPAQKDDELADQAAEMSGVVTSGPSAVGCVVADATQLSAAVLDFTTKLGIAENVLTRTPVTIAEKDTSRVNLIGVMRRIGKKVRAFPTITPAQLVSLRMNVPQPRTPLPPPATRPQLALTATQPLTLKFRMVDETTPTRRARPRGYDGAEVFSFVAPAGTMPPDDLSAYEFQGLMTRSEFELTFDGADAGKTAHVRARWYNKKGAVGSPSVAASAMIAA